MRNKVLPLIILSLLFYDNGLAQVTFECEDVKIATKPLKQVSYEKGIQKLLEDPSISCPSSTRPDSIISCHSHPFISAVHESFNEHRPLVISPDMIWLLIAQGVCQHINYYDEDLRNKLVNFEDKMELTVLIENIAGLDSVQKTKTFWELVVPMFAEKIKRNTKNDFHDFMVPKYTTTTDEIQFAYQVTLMSSVKKYFSYGVSSVCGIPKITLEGTPEDWSNLRKSSKSLSKYGLIKWEKALSRILIEFENASKGKIDTDFWVNIYKFDGGYRSGGDYISGWIINFFPYLDHGQGSIPSTNPYLGEYRELPRFQGLKFGDFFKGQSNVKIKFEGPLVSEPDIRLYAGFVGFTQDKETMAVRPEIGWGIKEE